MLVAGWWCRSGVTPGSRLANATSRGEDDRIAAGAGERVDPAADLPPEQPLADGLGDASQPGRSDAIGVLPDRSGTEGTVLGLRYEPPTTTERGEEPRSGDHRHPHRRRGPVRDVLADHRRSDPGAGDGTNALAWTISVNQVLMSDERIPSQARLAGGLRDGESQGRITESRLRRSPEAMQIHLSPRRIDRTLMPNRSAGRDVVSGGRAVARW